MNIKDVAKRAGVSVATVSYYINGTRNVAPPTAQKIQQAIEALHYSPNLVARGLKTSSNKTIAVLVQDITSGYFNSVLEGVAEVLNQQGYNVLLCITWNRPDYEIKDFKSMLSHRVVGIIMTPINNSFDFRSLCPEPNFPIVFIDRRQSATPADTVLCDNSQVTYRAISRLIQSGRRHIACFYSASTHLASTMTDRIEAYQQALIDHNIKPDPALIAFSKSSRDSYELLSKMRETTEVDAIFIASSRMAFGVLRYLRENEISVPEEIAVLNFDDYEWAESTAPKPLTTIKQPAREMGRSAARLMISRIENPQQEYQTILLDSELILRGSC